MSQEKIVRKSFLVEKSSKSSNFKSLDESRGRQESQSIDFVIQNPENKQVFTG
jgi:hypothetical protein